MPGKFKSVFYSLCGLLFVLSQTGCIDNRTTEAEPERLYTINNDGAPLSPGKGNIKGTIVLKADNQALENVEVILCDDVSIRLNFTCQGEKMRTKTDANGNYLFQDMKPGSYALAIKAPGTSKGYYFSPVRGISDVTEKLTLDANQTVIVAPQKIYKIDLKITTPAENQVIQERKPKLSWEAYPNADSYRVTIRSPSTSNIYLSDGGKPVKTTEVVPTIDLPDGVYTWSVSAYLNYGELAESGDVRFTIGPPVAKTKKKN